MSKNTIKHNSLADSKKHLEDGKAKLVRQMADPKSWAEKVMRQHTKPESEPVEPEQIDVRKLTPAQRDEYFKALQEELAKVAPLVAGDKKKSSGGGEKLPVKPKAKPAAKKKSSTKKKSASKK